MNLNRRDFLAATSLLSLPSEEIWSLLTPWNSPISGRPGLLVTSTDWASLPERRKADPDLDRFAAALIDRARRDISLPVLERKLTGRRLLGVSREFIRRGLQWSFAFRVSGDRQFLERAVQEMSGVAAFADWHPDHYLDVAEMTTGMAISYDWLFNDLSSSDRTVFRSAIIDKGIAQARLGHRTFRMTNNWNQVCIGGMVLGALAVEDDQPALASDLLKAAQKEVFTGLDAYRPDGVYPEGPAYWSYGTAYSILLIAALRGAKGTDWGVLAAPGFRRSAEFYAQSIGPSGKHFDFADGGEGQELPCAIVYLARELGQTAFLNSKRAMIRNKQGVADRFAPLSILWWPTDSKAGEASPRFSGQGPQPLAIWRSSWSDPNALWFGIKAGGAAHNHAHMDAGSFVLDMDGIRWARDLGSQDYNSLESRGIDLWNMKQGSSRWQVFRISADSHNTITVDNQPHSATGMASLRMVDENEALIDMTPVFLPGTLRKANRRARFANDFVQLDDELQGLNPSSKVRWAMTTDAEISIDGKQALLSVKGKRLNIRFEGEGIKLEVLDISAPRHDFDAANPNMRQLLVTGQPGPDGTWKLGTRFSRS